MYTWNSVCIKTNCIFFFLLTLCKRTLCMWVVWELNGLILRSWSVSCSQLVLADVDFLWAAQAGRAPNPSDQRWWEHPVPAPSAYQRGRAWAVPGCFSCHLRCLLFLVFELCLTMSAGSALRSPLGWGSHCALAPDSCCSKRASPAAGARGRILVQCHAREIQAFPQLSFFFPTIFNLRSVERAQQERQRLQAEIVHGWSCEMR